MSKELSWVKLKTDMFDDEKIIVIESLPDSANILLIWIKLICQSGKCNTDGTIQLSETIKYTDEMLAKIFHCELNTVRLALSTFDKMGMIEWESGEYLKITNWEKHQNIEGLERIRELTRQRVDKFRHKSLSGNNPTQLPMRNVTVTPCNATDRDRDREEDKDNKKEIREEISSSAEKNDEISDILLLYETNIEELKNGRKELIIAACEKYTAVWVTDAILNAADKKPEKRNWEYIAGTLRNWETEGHKIKSASYDKFQLPEGMILEGCSVERAIQIAEGKLDALPANKRRIKAELIRRGIPFTDTG